MVELGNGMLALVACDGVVLDKMALREKKKPVLGVGINDWPLATGYQCPKTGTAKHSLVYQAWQSMIKRAYDPKYRARFPTYEGVTVSEDWLKFSNFALWYVDHVTDECNQVEKDLITPGNKVYSPENCLLVPQWLNSLTIDCSAARGEFPVGVSFNKRCGKFKAYIRKHGKTHHLGYFSNPEESAAAYKAAKLEHVESLRSEIDPIGSRQGIENLTDKVIAKLEFDWNQE